MLDQLGPQDHRVRAIDEVIDSSFVQEPIPELYCADNGRPLLDPTLMFKSLFLDHLFQHLL